MQTRRSFFKSLITGIGVILATTGCESDVDLTEVKLEDQSEETVTCTCGATSKDLIAEFPIEDRNCSEWYHVTTLYDYKSGCHSSRVTTKSINGEITIL